VAKNAAPNHHRGETIVKSIVSLCAVAGVLLATGFAAADEKGGSTTQPGNGKPVDFSELIKALPQTQQELYRLKDTAVGANADYRAASQAAAGAERDFIKARDQLPPPPKVDAAPAEYRAWQQKQTDLTNLEKDWQKKQGQADMLGYQKNKAAQAVETFSRANPDVKLPDWANTRLQEREQGTRAKEQSMPKHLFDVEKEAYKQAEAAKALGGNTGPVIDGSAGGKGAPDLKPGPGAPGDPLPDNKGQGDALRDAPAPKPDPAREKVKRELDTEAAAITAEANRIGGWRQDLENRKAGLEASRQRIEANAPNISDPDAVRRYNEEVNRWNREKDTLNRDVDRFNVDRMKVLDRVKQFEERVAKFQGK
jgi:hypothetical protein